MFYIRNINKLVARLLKVQLIIIISLFPLILVAYAQSSVDGTLLINSGNQYATSQIVNLTLRCSPGSGSYCGISITFDNIDANQDSKVRDAITGIIVSSTATTVQDFPEATETGVNTGVFSFEIDNDTIEPGDDFTYGEDDIITVANIPFSSSNGIKMVDALFDDGFTSTNVSDSIILDTIAPTTVTGAISPSNNTFLNDNTPILEWSKASDTNTPILYEIVLYDNQTNSPTLSVAYFPSPNIILSTNTTDYQYPIGFALDDNTYYWRVRATDAADNTGLPSPTFTFTVDTISPDAPLITSPDSDSITMDNTPSISGIAEEGADVEAYIDGTEIKGTFARSGSEWSFTPSSPLSEGSHSITARASDQAGNISPFSLPLPISVDTSNPIGSLEINSGAEYTSSLSVTLDISCEGSSSECYQMSISIDGSFDTEGFEPFLESKSVILSSGDGRKTVMLVFRDNAGNVSPVVTDEITLDTVPPDAPRITDPASGSITDDANLTIRGTEQEDENVSVEIIDGSKIIGRDSIRANEDTWSVTTQELSSGPHKISARIIDSAGNVSPLSNEVVITVDSTGTPSGSVRIQDPIIVDPNTPVVVTLDLSCSDSSDCSEMRIALDGNLDTERFEEFVPTKEVTLSLGDGEKTILVQYKDAAGKISPIAKDSILIEYPPIIPPEWIIMTVVGGGVVAAVLIKYAVKMGKLNIKFNPTFRIEFDYGIQGEKNYEHEEMALPSKGSIENAANGINKLHEEFGSATENMLGEVKQKLGQLKQITEFVNLCRDARQDPDEAISKLSSKLLENMISHVKPYIAKLFVEDISAQIKLKGINDAGEEKSLTAKLDVDIKPIDPYIGVSILVNEIKKFSIRFVFRLDTSAHIQKLEIRTVPMAERTKTAAVGMDLHDVTISLKLSLLNVFVSYFNRPMLQKPIEIAEREFQIQKLSILKVSSEEEAIRAKSAISIDREAHTDSTIDNDAQYAAPVGVPVSGPITEMQYVCRKCNNVVASGNKFCVNCGEPVN